MGFYERYSAACSKKGISPHTKKIPELFGFDSSLPSKWKKEGITPEAEKVKVIADVLEVSTDYLLERTDDPRDFSKYPELLSDLYGPQYECFNGDIEKTMKFKEARDKDALSEKPYILDLFNQLTYEDKIDVTGYIKGILSKYPSQEKRNTASHAV